MDPKNPVNGENAETPAVSQTETITPEQTEDDNPQGASNVNPEEVAWNELKGGTQERFRQLLDERDRLKERELRRDVPVQPTYQVPQNPNSPEVQSAVAQLSNVGIATDAKVEEKINQRIGNLIYNFELEKLETKYDGDDNLPKFDRREYEDFVQKNPQYQTYSPEDVYEKMYSEEILDAKLKGRETAPTKPGSLKPTKTVVREEQWTPDWIEQRMKQPDGLSWYASNKQKVNDYLQSQHKADY